DRFAEAAALADRSSSDPSDPLARLVVARGRLIRGEISEALRLASGVDCGSVHDPELSRALRAIGPFKPGDGACDQPQPVPTAPFDPMSGSFESAQGWEPWQVEGDAFGPSPSTTRSAGELYVNGFHGKQIANSFAPSDSDDAKGLLRSPPFTIEADGISF